MRVYAPHMRALCGLVCCVVSFAASVVLVCSDRGFGLRRGLVCGVRAKAHRLPFARRALCNSGLTTPRTQPKGQSGAAAGTTRAGAGSACIRHACAGRVTLRRVRVHRVAAHTAAPRAAAAASHLLQRWARD
eukprot:508696-Prymnesium_polylepis.1